MIFDRRDMLRDLGLTAEQIKNLLKLEEVDAMMDHLAEKESKVRKASEEALQSELRSIEESRGSIRQQCPHSWDWQSCEGIGESHYRCRACGAKTRGLQPSSSKTPGGNCAQ